MREYIQKIGAQATVTVNARGNFVRYMLGYPQIMIETRDGERKIPMLQGDSFATDDLFDGLLVTNLGNATDEVRLLIGQGRYAQQAITGTVAVSDIPGPLRYLQDRLLFRAMDEVPIAPPGEFPFSQLWNPLGSGVNLIVLGCIAHRTAGVTGVVVFKIGGYSVAISAFGSNGQNQFFNGPDSVAETRHTDETVLNPTIAYFASALHDTVNSPGVELVRSSEPILVPPGVGPLVKCFTAQTAFTCLWTWVEARI
jgi:hypothetical protein